MIKNIIVFSLIVLTIGVLAGCKKGMNDMSPQALAAAIMANGNNVTNGTMSNPNQDDRLMIRAQFFDPQGNQTIHMAVASYKHGHGMMNHMGEITLWDDGHHGDDMHGDGWYSWKMICLT
jgi:hypothetical protein